MIQTDAQERKQILESPCKPNNTTPGLLSCYGMIFKWAKVRQNQHTKQERNKIAGSRCSSGQQRNGASLMPAENNPAGNCGLVCSYYFY
jgi:hypothetical protein